MYILFYPLKFPSTPVLILFKVLQHHNNLCDLGQDSNLHSSIGFMTTYRPVLILESNLWQFATLFLLTVRLCILHTPLLWGDFPILPTRSVGKTGLEPATPGSQNQCSNQLNYFPIIAVF